MLPSFLDKSRLPPRSGVYQFKDRGDHVLYVGKSINLRSRVYSYFQKDVDGKTAILIAKIASVNTIVVESELEALILEANLIKKYQPPFNVRLMDDKDYLYIAITKEDFPKIATARKKDLTSVKKFFGPFPSSRTVRDTLKQLRRVFPWCSSPPKTRLRPCFYFHLGLCPGACVGLISQSDYQKIITRFSRFLEGKKSELVSELTEEMMKLSASQKYEAATKLKKMLDGINYLTQTNRAQIYLENPNFLEQESQLALLELQKDLNLPRKPVRIEGYDISNTSGKQAVGSMVVVTNGDVDKSQYRKFKINPPAGGSGRPNDVGMLAEMVRRRLKHPEWPMPDLMLVDGGRAQARAAKYEIRSAEGSLKNNTKYEIPVLGLAKRMEWLYPPDGDIIKLPKKSLSLRLLQKLRDESHRFANVYHRKLRDMIK